MSAHGSGQWLVSAAGVVLIILVVLGVFGPVSGLSSLSTTPGTAQYYSPDSIVGPHPLSVISSTTAGTPGAPTGFTLLNGQYPNGGCTVGGITFCAFGEAVQFSSSVSVGEAMFGLTAPLLSYDPKAIPPAGFTWNGTLQGIIFPADGRFVTPGNLVPTPNVKYLGSSITNVVLTPLSSYSPTGQIRNEAFVHFTFNLPVTLVPGLPYVVGVLLTSATSNELNAYGSTSSTGYSEQYGQLAAMIVDKTAADGTLGWTDYWECLPGESLCSGITSSIPNNLYGWNFDNRYDAVFSLCTVTCAEPSGGGFSLGPVPLPWILLIIGLVLVVTPVFSFRRRSAQG